MEFVDWCPWDDSGKRPTQALQTAVQVLHKAGFVHGDLRSVNILVVGHSVRIVDFEWAGIADCAEYPFVMITLT